MRIVLLGSGNVATVLGRMLKIAGHVLLQVYARNAVAAEQLAAELNGMGGDAAIAISDPSRIDPSAELYLLSLSDTALPDVFTWLNLSDRLVAHTAGSVSKDVLAKVSANYGILYPLQSLRKEMKRIPEIPFFIDGNTPENTATLLQLATTLSPYVRVADDATRLKLHTGAIIVNNFTNYLFTLAEEYCIKEQIDFSMLKPLIREVAGRLEYASPKALQTGPAIRDDQSTIDKHMEILKTYPSLLGVYKMLTESIRSFYSSPSED